MKFGKDNYLVNDMNGKSTEMDLFRQIFGVSSPFAVSCQSCDSKFMKSDDRRVKNLSDPTKSSLPENVIPNTGPSTEPILADLALSNLALSDLPLQNQHNSADNQTDNKFAIYVSKFKPIATCDNLAAYITSKTSLVRDTNFTIENLTGKVNKHRKINFVSFKITTSCKDDYDVVMNKDLWGSLVAAIPFEPPQKPQKPSIKPKTQTPKPKQKQQKTQHQKISNKTHSQNIKQHHNKNNNKAVNMHRNQIIPSDVHTERNHHLNGNFNVPNGHHMNYHQSMVPQYPHYPNFHLLQRNNHMPLFQAPFPWYQPAQLQYHQQMMPAMPFQPGYPH